MPGTRSQYGRTITPSSKKVSETTPEDVIVISKQKRTKKSTTKRKPPPPPRTPTPPTQSEEEEAQPPLKQRNMPVDVYECKYTIACVTMFNDKKLFPDTGSYHLGTFKLHDYNAKGTKAVHKAAEKAKVGYELESAVATISGQRLKQSSKTIEDPFDWEALEENIEEYMKQKVKMLRVDYVVTYVKTRRHGNSYQMDANEDLDDNEVSPARKRQRNNVFLH